MNRSPHLSSTAPEPARQPTPKRVYVKPLLRCHGDLRAKTLGPSPGPEESANFNTHGV